MSPPVLPTDQHKQHIDEHALLLSSPESLENGTIVPPTLQHIEEHINALRTVDPALLMLLGQTPLPPVPGMAALPTGTPPAPPGGTPGHQPGPAPAPPPNNGAGKQPQLPQQPHNPLTGQRATPSDGAIKS